MQATMAGGTGAPQETEAGVVRMTCALTGSHHGAGPAPSAQIGALVPSLRGCQALMGMGPQAHLGGSVTLLRNARGTFGPRSRTRPVRGAK